MKSVNSAGFNEGSNYDREGQYIRALYLGEFPVKGFVEVSRVKYGGKVSHIIVSDCQVDCKFEVKPVGYRFAVDEESIFTS